ncbi:hypothetical protein A3B84_00395 [Candidatus Nomurabacteria bacterium RIFCSPHIGHO2_02_FULL_35_13]|uniref:Type II secretion system protein J n=2 Tax=Candidatus Nomuraibacteriota TaxID=1752729 RepID=A0A1F6VQ43_9BACT|nr:MAG: Type 4 fimbrial biogenesis protein PilV [Candidatus Nomurabacteria bacterium GW2011_GWA1_35_8]OGI71555.1 MAG: hypothetical protein A3B84_00395 [Candidatus Nomurabacteria bacterium RIFCSPHIGHO2_02_FULL_35_13]
MIKFFKQKNKNKVCPAKPWRSRGFTLVETLVAISIFSMSIVAIMSVLGNGVSDTNYAKQKMIASYLAQEGIEYIRNMRDTYVLYTDTTGNDWDAFKNVISECGNAGGGGGNTKNCYFDDENLIQPCGNDLCSNHLLYDSSTGKYNYTSGIDSGFIRSIQARYPSGPNSDIKINSIISWTQPSGSFSVEFSENLFDWVE